MDPLVVQNILLSILTSIITGGFILVYIEIGNRRNRHEEHYFQKMNPFMHKFSSYCRFMSWVKSHIVYPKQLNQKEKQFKILVDEIGEYGSTIIISGGDYTIDYFTAKKLEKICLDINNIWYYYDKMNPSNLNFDLPIGTIHSFIKKELGEVFPIYISHPINLNLISIVSGDFFTDIYQPIEYDSFLHEKCEKIFKLHSIFVIIAVCFVLFVLTTMLFIPLSLLSMRIIGIIVVILLIICFLMLGINMKFHIKLYNKVCIKITGLKKRKKHRYK